MNYAYYVYYRVNPDHLLQCQEACSAILAAVYAATGIQGRVLKKRKEPYLWMEVYENVESEAEFEWALAEAVSNSQLPAYLQAGQNRHIECFSE